MLQEGNARFVEGEAEYPHTSPERMHQAGIENQGDHAYATVITCSDSRVPPELIFDAGIMDLFVIRVAGNVCDTDEVGSIEYGLCHVNTPVLVVLGHTQCGAVTAVTHMLHGHESKFERNIPPLVEDIIPAVEEAEHLYPYMQGDQIIPLAIEQNVWKGITDLFTKSPATRQLVHEGKVKVVGAIYDVGSGRVYWLPQERVPQILALVEETPDIATNPYWEESDHQYTSLEDDEDACEDHDDEETSSENDEETEL
jgi:carbonic anhydrase